MNTKLIIQDTLREINETIFFPKGIQVELLKNFSQAIPILVEWIFEEWRSYDCSLTKEKLMNGFSKRLNDDRIPFTLVAFRKGIPIGTVSLKEQDEPEMIALSKGDPWLGSLQIAQGERQKGLGDGLLKAAKMFGMRLSYKNIFVYTSNPANLEWYYKRGARFVETRSFQQHLITIMQIPFKLPLK